MESRLMIRVFDARNEEEKSIIKLMFALSKASTHASSRHRLDKHSPLVELTSKIKQKPRDELKEKQARLRDQSPEVRLLTECR